MPKIATLASCFKTHGTPEKLKLKIMERVFSLKGDKDGNLQHLPAVMAMIKDAEDRRAVLVGKIEAAGGVVGSGGPAEKEGGKYPADYATGLTGKQPGDFIQAPGGMDAFGEISPEIAKEIRREKGEIRLQQGEHEKDSKYGITHIKERHKYFKSDDEIISFVNDVAGNFNEIWSAEAGQLLLVKKNGSDKVAYIQLQPSPDGSFYTVKTAFKARKGEGIELLWSDAQSQTIVPGQQQDFAVDPQNKTGEENPSTLSESNSNTETIPPAPGEIKANTEDSGEELTRNKRNRYTSGLTWNDIKNSDEALRVKEVVKAKVYPKPDYASMIKDGDNRSSITAHILKQVYDGIGAKPYTSKAPTDEQLQQYIDAVNRVMDAVKKWIESDSAHGWINSVAERAQRTSGRGGIALSAMIEKADESFVKLYDAIYPEGWKARKDEVIILGGNRFLRSIQPGLDEVVKAMKDIDQGWPGKVDSWKKQGYKIVKAERIIPSYYEGSGSDNKKYVAITFKLMDEHGKVHEYGSQFIYGTGKKDSQDVNDAVTEEEIKISGNFILLSKSGRFESAHETEQDAIAAAEAKVKRQKNVVKEEGLAVTEVERTGVDYRLPGEDINSDRLKDTFGFKGVNFGNWMKGNSNEKERQLHLNHAFDSFMDLASILGVPPKAISLDGLLGIAIGAQGTSGALAHFVPGVNEINLTRVGGSGSVAHEWAHAVDHYFARIAGLSRGGEPWLTENYHQRNLSQELRPEILEHFKKIVKAMNTRQATEEEIQKAATDSKTSGLVMLARWAKNINTEMSSQAAEGLTVNVDGKDVPFVGEVSRLTLSISKLDVGDGKVAVGPKPTRRYQFQTFFSPEVAELRDIYKKAFGRTYNIENLKALQSHIDSAIYRRDKEEEIQSHVPQQRKTDFYLESVKLDQQKKGKAYWSTNLEMFARAFSAYVTDKLNEQNAKNTYLSRGGKGPGYVPIGTDRTAINSEFDALIKEIRTKETDKGVALYSQSPSPISNPSSISDLSRDQQGVVKALEEKGKVQFVSAARAMQVLEMAGMSREEAKYMVAWHGSPHDHDGFKTEKIGTGEGAQAYGYGLYFAGSKEVAEHYKQKLSGNTKVFLDGKEMAQGVADGSGPVAMAASYFRAYEGKYLEAIDDIESQLKEINDGSHSILKYLNTGESQRSLIKEYQTAIDFLRTNNEKMSLKEQPGRLYQVDLAPSADEYLDWDKPLSEQSEKVKAALEEGGLGHWFDAPKATGRSLYSTLGMKYKTDKKASEFLHSLGIRGIRYLDGTSRSKGEGQYNYVIFNDQDVKITAKYSEDGKTIQGFVMPDGRTFIIPENIEKGKLWNVVLHEVGVHASQLLHSNNEFKQIIKSIERRQNDDTATGKAIREAYDRVPKDTKAENIDEEALAYLIENSPEVGFVRRVIAMIKRILVKIGVNVDIFTAEDFAALADIAVRREARAEKGGVAVGVGEKELSPLFSKRKETANTPLSTDALQDIAATVGKASKKGSIKFIKNKKVDSTFLDRVLSTPEYYFKKFAAAGRVLQAALLRRDIRHEKETEILGGFVEYIQKLRKTNKKAYDEANEHLVEVDQQAKGFRIKTTDSGKFKVYRPKWAVKLEGIDILTTRPNFKTNDEGVVTETFDEELSPRQKEIERDREKAKKLVVGEFEEEQEAVKAMLEAESAALAENGMSAEAIEAVKQARQLTNRGFDVMAADMRAIIAEAKENGQPDPFIGDGKLDESGRYGVYAAGKSKPIALFATEMEASAFLEQAAQMISYMVTSQKAGSRDFNNELKAKKWAAMHSGTVRGVKTFQNLSVKKRSNADMRPLTVKQALAQMGDLRGIFFPRIREPGAYVLIAKKDGENPIRKHFDIPTVGDETPTLQKFLSNTTPIGREAEILKAKDYTVTIKKDDSPSEDVFQATNLMTSVDALLTNSMEGINKNDDAEVRAGQHINQLLTMEIADIFKSRGYLSSRLKRLAGDVVWEGYETDMGKALTGYGKNVAAGTAKRDTARAMILAFTGRDYSWADYKAEVDKPVWAEYQKIVEARRIDDRTQKNLFRDVRAFMIDVLRNDEQADRIVGTLKGLAVAKFLGFRVSSAAVNMTNMVLGVPATMAGHTGESIGKALIRVTEAATAYGKYRSGKGDISQADRELFQYISAKGWDEAQYNEEAARELRGKLGDGWNKFMTASMYMFGAAEKANRSMTLFAAYKAVKSKSPTAENEVIWEKAKAISDRAHGTYGKETLPDWARGTGIGPRTARPFYTFKKFQHNYMLNAIDLGFNKKEYAAASYMLLSPAILAGSGATLASPVLFALAGALGIGGDDPEEEFYAWAEKTFGGGAFARQGLFGAAGINIKGSLEMNFPTPGDLGKANLLDLAGPVGGIVTDTSKGLQNLFAGNLAKGVEFLLPTAFGSMSKSVREASEGVTTSNYGSVFYGDEPLKADTMDAILRFMSFNPARLSGIREMQWNEKEVAASYQAQKTEIYARIKRLHIKGESFTPEILKEISVYNERVFGAGRPDIKPITPRGIRTMLKRNDKPGLIERSRQTDEE